MRKGLATFLLSIATTSVFAHPGEHHGDLLATLWHLVSEPDHLAMLMLAVIVGAAAAIAQRRRARVRGKP